jgi:hypothetical protein
MIRGLLDIITGRSEYRNRIQRVALVEPLQRFNDVEEFGYFPLFKSLARALAKQTSLMVESLLSDQAIADWASAGESATVQQLRDLGIFCSHCLVQFAIKGMHAKPGAARLPAGLTADLSDLVRLMYGDFATKSPLGAITFDESLQSRNLDDAVEIRDLTRLVDQLLGIECADNANRDVKIEKMRGLITAHRRAFAYKLHGIL